VDQKAHRRRMGTQRHLQPSSGTIKCSNGTLISTSLLS
jgi:hypothetical protein